MTIKTVEQLERLVASGQNIIGLPVSHALSMKFDEHCELSIGEGWVKIEKNKIIQVVT